jgi:hypothetical protein
LTRTVQPLSLTVVRQTEKAKKAESEDNTADGNVSEILSLCDSLNNLCEKLSRLDYLLKRKIIEKNLSMRKTIINAMGGKE